MIYLLIFNWKQCNQEGHMASDCPNPGSGSVRSSPRNRTNAAPAFDDWGTSSTTSSSPWATGANAAPRGGGRATPSAIKSNDDDWGAAVHSWTSVTGKSGGDRSRPSRSAAPTPSSADSWDVEPTSKASASRDTDDWGMSTLAS